MNGRVDIYVNTYFHNSGNSKKKAHNFKFLPFRGGIQSFKVSCPVTAFCQVVEKVNPDNKRYSSAQYCSYLTRDLVILSVVVFTLCSHKVFNHNLTTII